MENQLVFLRHARESWRDGRCVVDSGQCATGASDLRDLGFGMGSPILSSVADRAVETAKQIGGRIGLSLFCSERVYSMSMRDTHDNSDHLPRDMEAFIRAELGEDGTELWHRFGMLAVVVHAPLMGFFSSPGAFYGGHCVPYVFDEEDYARKLSGEPPPL